MEWLNSELLCNYICLLTTLFLTTFYEFFLIKKLSDTLYQPGRVFELPHSFDLDQDPLRICSLPESLPHLLQEANYLTPISFFLILIHCVSSNPRRSYLIKTSNRFLNLLNYISLPQIQNVFSKKRRLLYCFGFSIVSFHVITTTLTNLFVMELSIDPVQVVREITEQLSDVLFIGCRYLPMFMALDSKSLVNRIVVGVYLLFDLSLSWYQQAVCLDSIRIVIFGSLEKVEYITIVCIGLINFLHSLFTSYMIVYLTLGSLFQLVFLERQAMNKINNKSIVCSEYKRLLRLANTDELFICTDDLKYTKRLLASLQEAKSDRNNLNSVTFLEHYKFERGALSLVWHVGKKWLLKLCYDFIKFVDSYTKSIYDRHAYFRYSLRFMSTQMVYFSCSFYVCLFFANMLIQGLQPALLPLSTNQTLNSTDRFWRTNLTSSQVFCKIKNLDLLCGIPAVQDIDIYAWLWLTYLVTLLGSFAIFIFQLLQNFRGYKYDLTAIYKGEHEFNEVRSQISNAEVAVKKA